MTNVQLSKASSVLTLYCNCPGMTLIATLIFHKDVLSQYKALAETPLENLRKRPENNWKLREECDEVNLETILSAPTLPFPEPQSTSPRFFRRFRVSCHLTNRTPGISLTIIVKLVCQCCRFICDHTATTTALAILKSLRSSLEAHKNSTHLWCLLHEATSDIYTFLTEDGMLLKPKATPSVKGLPVSIY